MIAEQKSDNLLDASESRVNPKRAWPWLIVSLLIISAMEPFLTHGFLETQDIVNHLWRVVLIDWGLRHGTFFARWIPELVDGYGSPMLTFYAPASYYLAEFLHLAGLALPSALLSVGGLWLALGTIGIYLFARDFYEVRSPWPALVAAAGYAYAPYLLTNLYVRGAVPEVGAQALLPWMLWGARRLMTSDRPSAYILPFALSVGGLALTHTLSLLFLPPVVLGYAAVVWWKHRPPREGPISLGAGLLAAMGMTAFFWLPLLGERSYLARTAYQQAMLALPSNVFRWNNLIDTGFRFTYGTTVPFRLGIVQVVLGLLGMVLARRRDLAWWYWAAVGACALALASAPAQPLWASNDALLAIQFPWRLLTIVDLSLALFLGGSLLRFAGSARRTGAPDPHGAGPGCGVREHAGSPWACALAALGIIGLVVASAWPLLSWTQSRPVDDRSLTMPALAAYESRTREYGATSSWSKEFFPRWVDIQPAFKGIALGGQATTLDPVITVDGAGRTSFDATITSPAGGSLRFKGFFFPGWRAVLDGHTELQPYPSTTMGLLTVDLPAGTHRLSVAWGGTPLQRAAGGLTLLSLAALAWWYARSGRFRGQRSLAVFPLALLAAALAGLAWPRPAGTVQTPAQPVAGAGLELLAYSTEMADPSMLLVHPYWYVAQRPPKNVHMSWQLRGAAGQLIAEDSSRPYYGTLDAGDWPAGTVAGDAYQVMLPPGLSPGSYQLCLAIDSPDVGGRVQVPRAIGTVTVPAAVPQTGLPTGTERLDLSFGGQALLAGYDMAIGPQAAAVGGPRPVLSQMRPAVVHPGDALLYTLYWYAQAPMTLDYHSFIHLVDFAQRPLLKVDHLAGERFASSTLWSSAYPSADFFTLVVPTGTVSGLYWPEVGLYDFDTVGLLAVRDSAGREVGDSFALPPIKVVSPIAPAPQHDAYAQVGTLGTLQGFDLAVVPPGAPAAAAGTPISTGSGTPSGPSSLQGQGTGPAQGPSPGQGPGAISVALPELVPGAQLTLTLYFHSQQPASVDYTRFVHLYSPALGMAAQSDGVPQGGDNPTGSWVPGETIADQVTLKVDEKAPPGPYVLQIGFYNPAGGQRVPVQDRAGRPLPDAQVSLATLMVAR